MVASESGRASAMGRIGVKDEKKPYTKQDGLKINIEKKKSGEKRASNSAWPLIQVPILAQVVKLPDDKQLDCNPVSNIQQL